MKKIIFRKLYSDTLSFFVFFLFIMSVIIWTIQAVNYFDYVSEDGHGLRVYFSYTILSFPKTIDRIFSFIYFISLFYTIINYENKNELNIFWLNGISKINFLNRLIIFSLFIMIIQIFLSSYLSPLSQQKARESLKNSNVNFFSSLMKPGKFNNLSSDLTIYMNEDNLDGSYNEIFLEDLRDNSSKMIFANRGEFIEEGNLRYFNLYSGEIINYEKNQINIFNFDEIKINLNNLSTKTITVLKVQERLTSNLLNCVMSKNFDKIINCDERIISEMKRELFKRLIKPVYIPIITLMCCYLIIRQKKNKDNIRSKFIIFIFVILVLLFSEASSSYIETSKFLNYFTFFVPIFLFTILINFFYRFTKYD